VLCRPGCGREAEKRIRYRAGLAPFTSGPSSPEGMDLLSTSSGPYQRLGGPPGSRSHRPTAWSLLTKRIYSTASPTGHRVRPEHRAIGSTVSSSARSGRRTGPRPGRSCRSPRRSRFGRRVTCSARSRSGKYTAEVAAQVREAYEIGISGVDLRHQRPLRHRRRSTLQPSARLADPAVGGGLALPDLPTLTPTIGDRW
jgi:hypothetical protein